MQTIYAECLILVYVVIYKCDADLSNEGFVIYETDIYGHGMSAKS